VEAFPGYWGRPPTLRFGARALEEAHWARARSLVAAFVRARPGLLHRLPEDEARRGQAWPSPRSWDFLSRLLASATQGGGAVNDALPLLGGCIGDGPALEFATWARELDLPDPDALLADPGTYQHPRRGDQAYAVLSAVCQAAIGDLTPARWQAAWQILARAASVGGADVAATAARSLARARTPELPLPVAQLTPFLPLLQAAGLVDAPGAPATPAARS
jgi:hypothetical protein